MYIICTDGTTIECHSFRAIDTGVLLFDEDDEEQANAIGFVPMASLQYVLPDEIVEQQQGMVAAQQPPRQAQQQQQFQQGQPPQDTLSPR